MTTKWQTKWETKCGLATGVTLHDPPGPSRTLQNLPYTFRAHTMGGSIQCCLKISKASTDDDKVGDKDGMSVERGRKNPEVI